MIVYSNIPTVIEGGQQEAIVSDWDAQGLLTNMLKELKVLNLHMMVMTDISIDNEEIEV